MAQIYPCHPRLKRGRLLSELKEESQGRSNPGLVRNMGYLEFRAQTPARRKVDARAAAEIDGEMIVRQIQVQNIESRVLRGQP